MVDTGFDGKTTQDTLRKIDHSYVSGRLNLERNNLFPKKGVGQVNEFGQKEGDEVIMANTFDITATYFGNKNDLPFEINNNQWLEMLTDYENKHSMTEVFMMLDGMNLAESWSILYGNYEKKINLKNSFLNFNNVCVYKYGANVVGRLIRDSFSDRMELFEIAGDGKGNYAKSLGINNEWNMMSYPEKMKYVYGGLLDSYVEMKSYEYRYNGGDEVQSELKSDKNNLMEKLIGVPEMDAEVYNKYRGGGFEKGRFGIENFDRAVGYLITKGVIKFDKNGFFKEIVSDNKTGMDYVKTMKKIMGEWVKTKENGGVDDNLFYRELLAGIERWSLNYEIAIKKNPEEDSSNYFRSLGDYYLNPSVVFGVELILTEKTRLYKLPEIKTAYRKLALENHPDTSGSNNRIGMMRLLNESYSVLRDKEKFEKMSGGW